MKLNHKIVVQAFIFHILTSLIVSCVNRQQSEKDEFNHRDYITSYDPATASSCLLHINGDTLIPTGIYNRLYWIDEQGMIRGIKNGKYGYVDMNGKILIPFEYEDLGYFLNDSEPVPAKKEGKYGYINRSGEVVIPFLYQQESYFKSGLCKVCINGKYGLINTDGEEVIPIIYDAIFLPLEDSFAAVKKEKKWAFFTLTGERLSDFMFDKIEETEEVFSFFRNGPALVRKGKNVAFYDQDMNVVVPFGVYNNAKPFNNMGVAIVKKWGKYGVINKQGELLIPTEYNKIERVSKQGHYYSLLALRKGKSISILNKELKPITNHKIKAYETNMYLIIKDYENKYALFDDEGNEKTPFIYDYLEYFCMNNLIAKSGDKYGLISSENDTIAPFEFDLLDGKHFHEFIITTKENKKGVINYLGEPILPCEYEEIYYPHDNLGSNNFLVQQNGKLGKVDSNNKIIIPIIYDDFSGWVEYGPGAHFVKKDNKYGIMSYEGEIIIPIIYDWVGLPECGVVPLRKDKKHGIMSWKGHEEIIPFIYDEMIPDINESSDFFDEKESKIVVRKDSIWLYLDLKGNVINKNVPLEEIEKRYAPWVGNGDWDNDYMMMLAGK